jgi:putative endonuclease
MSWICYILRCADDTLYTGITKDLDKRVASHNSGTAAKYTRGRRPVTLLFAEPYADKPAALRRECAIKRMSRSDKLLLAASGPTIRGKI